MSMQLNGAITIVAGGNTPIGTGIVKSFLVHNALVIVPVPDAEAARLLRQETADIGSGQLITILTDVMDYERVNDIKKCIQELYGRVHLVVAAFNNQRHSRPLLDIDPVEWQKAIDENITAHFITGRVALQLMKEQQSGMFVSICDADVFAQPPYASLTRLLTENQTELSVIFSEEVRSYNVRYYHLFVKDIITEPSAAVCSNTQATTPQTAGEHIIKLYHRQTENSYRLFQYFPEHQACS